jgi:hypothetical protein
VTIRYDLVTQSVSLEISPEDISAISRDGLALTRQLVTELAEGLHHAVAAVASGTGAEK